MLALKNVGKTYPNGVRALDGVSLSIGIGEGIFDKRLMVCHWTP